MSEYKPSAAAIHTTRTLVRNFIIREKLGGEYQLTFDTIVKLIDVFTQAHRVEKVLNDLAQKVHWVDREKLVRNLELFRDAARTIEIVRKGMPRFGPREEDPGVSAPALTATRVLMRHFEFERHPETGRFEATEWNIAITIDVCTKIRVAEEAMDDVLSLPWQDKFELERALETLRMTVRAVESAKNQVPAFDSRPKPIWRKEGKVQEPQLTSRQMEVLRNTSIALDKAKTPAEEQTILQETARSL